MRQQFIGIYPHTPFFWLMTLPEKRRKAIQENMGMVVVCIGEPWNVEVKNEEEGGCNERSWKESGKVKECKSEKEFWLQQGELSWEGLTCWVWVFTRILIVVQVLASSQSESISKQTVTGGPGCSQLLAQCQALRGCVSVTIKDQYSPSTLLASERTAHRHV